MAIKNFNFFEVIPSIVHGIESYHDSATVNHELRTGHIMDLMGQALGFNTEYCTILKESGKLHDIGKISIPETILLKPSKLTHFEKKVIQLHPAIGYDFIRKIDHPYTSIVGSIILYHHESYDGTGYPNGLKGEDIPIEAAICSVCDVYDALREERIYRPRLSHEVTFNLMFDQSPKGLYFKFNPKLMDVLKEIESEIKNYYSNVELNL